MIARVVMVTISNLLKPSLLGMTLIGCIKPPAPGSEYPPIVSPQAVPDFDQYALAHEPYQLLLDAPVTPKVTPNTLDRGCHFINYNMPVPTMEPVRFEGDGKVQPCEVFEYALDNHEDHSAAAEVVVGGEIPWWLGDHRDFKGGAMQTKVREAIRILKSDPVIKNEFVLSDSYMKRISIGLYIFAQFPRDRAELKAMATETKEESTVFDQLGATEFQAWLLEHGGMDIKAIEIDYDTTANMSSPLDTLISRRGDLTSPARILYAIFYLAQIDPVFIMVKSDEVARQLQATGALKFWRDSGFDAVHIPDGTGYSFMVGVPARNAPGGYMAFAPTLQLYFETSEDFYVLRPIHYLALDLISRAKREDDPEKQRMLFERATQMDPNSPDVPAAIASHAMSIGDLEKAEQVTSESLHVNPNSWVNLVQYGIIQGMKGDYSEAVKYLERAKEMNPSSSLIRHRLGLVLQIEGQFAKAETEFKKAIEINPIVTYYSALAALYLQLRKFDHAAQVLKDAEKKFPDDQDIKRLKKELEKALADPKARSKKN